MLLDDNKLKQVILVTAQELEQTSDKELKLFLIDKLDVILNLLETCGQQDLYDLFNEDTVDYITNIQLQAGELL
jgi:hypothetical protein